MPKDLLTAAWKLLLAARSRSAIVLGIVLIAWPQATIVVLMVLVGIWALIDGIGLAAQVVRQGRRQPVSGCSFGVMALVALVVAVGRDLQPGQGRRRAITWVHRHLAARAWSRSSWSAAFSLHRSAPRAGCSCSAPCSTSCSAGCSSPTPARRPSAVAVVIGILAIAWGVVFVVLALAARSATKDLPDDVEQPAAGDPRRPPRPERRFGRGPPRPVRCHLTKDRRLSRAPARDRRLRESGRPAQATNTSRHAVELAPRRAS